VQGTTVFADEDVLRRLRKIARRENRSFAEVTREALTEYVSRRRKKRSRLSLVGVGRSGRKDVAEGSEELLRKCSAFIEE
jgi:predicted CopG family antitoxin